MELQKNLQKIHSNLNTELDNCEITKQNSAQYNHITRAYMPAQSLKLQSDIGHFPTECRIFLVLVGHNVRTILFVFYWFKVFSMFLIYCLNKFPKCLIKSVFFRHYVFPFFRALQLYSNCLGHTYNRVPITSTSSIWS